MNVYYNDTIMKKESVSMDTRLITTISLKKSTFKLIETIMKTVPQSYNSRGKVVDEAVLFYFNQMAEFKEEGA